MDHLNVEQKPQRDLGANQRDFMHGPTRLHVHPEDTKNQSISLQKGLLGGKRVIR